MPEFQIDFSDVPDSDVAEGWHSARIFAVEDKESKAGNRMLVVQLKIEGGPWNGRSLFDNWMLETDALWRTRQIFTDLGFMSNDDKGFDGSTEDLIGIELEVRVVMEEYQGQARPRAKGIRGVTGDTIEALTA